MTEIDRATIGVEGLIERIEDQMHHYQTIVFDIEYGPAIIAALSRARPGVSDAMVEAALHARVPGGSEVWAWLPQEDAWTPHQTARDVMRAALEASLAAPLQRGAEPVSAQRYIRDWCPDVVRDYVAALEAAALAGQPEGWRTMDSAPKDGEPVDLWCLWPEFGKEGRTPDARWVKGEWFLNHFLQSQYKTPPVPKFWMRPATPAPTKGGEDAA